MTDAAAGAPGAQYPNAEVLARLLPAVGRRVRLAGAAAAPAEADTLVVAVLDGEEGLELIADGALGGAAEEVLRGLQAVGAKGALERTTRIPAPAGLDVDSIIAVGLGAEDPDADAVRRAAGAAVRAAAGAAHIASALGALDPAAALEGAGLGGYAYAGRKAEAGAAAEELTVTVLGAGEPAVARAAAVVDAVCTARDLVNTDSAALHPGALADAAAALAADAGLAAEVLGPEELAAGGYGGLLAVGGGSARGPRLVRLHHRGGAGAATRVGLVGKGVTFDTGGISLKPGANMENMISDMGGAAAVIATTVLAARLGLGLDVTATVPMAENMPDGRSYRPGDVITQYGGTTVEVLNTDAEGRLILADALVRATEDGPDYLLDTATLTGAQLVALGGRTPGVLGDGGFRDRVAELSRAVGEGGWAMPMPAELAEGLDSPVADLRNIGANREGGMSVAASFLRRFVPEAPEGPRWAHLDVAGPAYNTHAAWGCTPTRATGVPVRTLLAVLEDIAG